MSKDVAMRRDESPLNQVSLAGFHKYGAVQTGSLKKTAKPFSLAVSKPIEKWN
jgi:hypothetical protein